MTTRTALIAQAAAQMSAYPQYAGHFDGYVLVRIQRAVKTKMGPAFAAGELAIARPQAETSTSVTGKVGTFYTVYSMTNRCDTSVSAKWVEPVA